MNVRVTKRAKSCVTMPFSLILPLCVSYVGLGLIVSIVIGLTAESPV
jgi:hypothetical protein